LYFGQFFALISDLLRQSTDIAAETATMSMFFVQLDTATTLMNLAQTPRVAIIGAGLTGLSIARRFVEAGIESQLFDKSRGVSGRMATRRLEMNELTLRFDHGSPFLTPPQMQAIAEQMNSPAHPMPFDVATHSALGDESLICIADGMNQVGKWLARGLKIHLSQQVTEIVPSDGNRRWQIVTADDVVIDDFDWVVTTTPPRQAADILRLSNSAVVRTLNTIEPQGCWSLMLVTESALPLSLVSDPGSEIIERVINENAKGRSSEHLGLCTVHAKRPWSQRHMGSSKADVQNAMIAALQAVGFDSQNTLHAQLHRWLYAGVVQPLGQPYLADMQRGLICAGDWCLGNDIDSALASADATAAKVIQSLL
jgi:renalase